MSDVTVRVRGSHLVRVAPDRGTVHASVSYDGPEADQVREQAERSAAAIAETLRTLEDGPLARWTSDQVRVSAHRPWNESGNQLPLVHQAQVELTAEFAEPAAIGGWLAAAGPLGLQVGWVEWTLTDENRTALERRVRQGALRDAVDRAQDYADALKLGQVQVRTIADTGLLGRQAQPEMAMMGASYKDQDQRGLVLQPGDLEVSAEVEVEFVILRA